MYSLLPVVMHVSLASYVIQIVHPPFLLKLWDICPLNKWNPQAIGLFSLVVCSCSAVYLKMSNHSIVVEVFVYVLLESFEASALCMVFSSVVTMVYLCVSGLLYRWSIIRSSC